MAMPATPRCPPALVGGNGGAIFPPGAALRLAGGGLADLSHGPAPASPTACRFRVSLAIVWGLFRARARLHPVSGPGRLHGVRPAASRSGSMRRAAPSSAGEPRQLSPHALRARRIGRAGLVHRRDPVPADAALDARGGHHLRAVLRLAAVSRARPHRSPCCSRRPNGWAMLLVGARRRRRCSPPSPLPSAPSRFRCCSTSESDAFTAMGTSISLVWNNLPVDARLGRDRAGAVPASLATGLLGLIVVFPLLGHATWHAYRAIR